MKITLARCRICGSITHRVAHDRVHCPTCKKDRRFVGDPDAPKTLYNIGGYLVTETVTVQWTRFTVDDGKGQLLIVERSMVNQEQFNVTDTRNYKAGCRTMTLQEVTETINAWMPHGAELITRLAMP